MEKILDHLNSRNITVNTIDGAKDAATFLLREQPNRLLHTLGVVDQTINLLQRQDLPSEITERTIQAAFLHDIGYSNDFAFAGFHPYDGYIYLKENGWHPDVAAAVLHHSFAESLMLETHQELAHEYARVERSESALLITDLVTLADMHTASDGAYVPFEIRVRDARRRYGDDNVLVRHLEAHALDVAALIARFGLPE